MSQGSNVNIDDLPADAFTCARCGLSASWERFTTLALERAHGDGDARLVCEVCRRAETARRRPVSRQLKNKAETLRRAEARAVDLWNRLQRARYARDQSYWPVPVSPCERSLACQLAEANKAVDRHRRDLASLHAARAHGATERVRMSRRTSAYRELPANVAA